MKPDIEQKLDQLADAIPANDSFVSDVMTRIKNSPVQGGTGILPVKHGSDGHAEKKERLSEVPRKKQNKNHVLRRILMKNTFKFTAAAVILIAGILSLTMLNTTVTPVQAVQQIRKAMDNAAWMHFRADTTKIDGNRTEYWLSLVLGIEASQTENGHISFTNIKEEETLIYDPNLNTLTLSVADRNDLFKANSASEFLDLIIETLNGNDHAETTIKQENQNIIHEITIPRGNPPESVGTEIWRLTADKKTHLLTRMELEGWDETGTFIKVADFQYDYPESGPMDIYALGVPKAAVIIDKRPSDNLKTIIDRYETARKNEPRHNTTVVLYTRFENGNQIADEATIVYADGRLQRREQLSLRTDLIDLQRRGQLNLINEMGDSFDSMFTFWNDPSRLSRRMGEMYDGQYLHSVRRYLSNPDEYRGFEDTQSKNRNSTFSPQSFYHGWIGVGDFFLLGTRGEEITIIENEYAKEKDLICLQKFDVVDENNPETIRYPSPRGRRYKRLCYLDPHMDYICCRVETYLIQDKYWEKAFPQSDNYLIKNPNPSIEFTQREIREMTVYGQTPSGWWYPTEIQWKTTTQPYSGGASDNVSIIKIYLDSEREIPAETFNPESFYNYLSE